MESFCPTCGKNHTSNGAATIDLCTDCKKISIDLIITYGVSCKNCGTHNPHGQYSGHRGCEKCRVDLWGGNDQLFLFPRRITKRPEPHCYYCAVCNTKVALPQEGRHPNFPTCESPKCIHQYAALTGENASKKAAKAKLNGAGTTCEILAHHHEIMKDDPERLSTDFIKSLSGMKNKACKEVGN